MTTVTNRFLVRRLDGSRLADAEESALVGLRFVDRLKRLRHHPNRRLTAPRQLLAPDSVQHVCACYTILLKELEN